MYALSLPRKPCCFDSSTIAVCIVCAGRRTYKRIVSPVNFIPLYRMAAAATKTAAAAANTPNLAGG